MAKSLRSKFKRKIRALARSKKAHKEYALLEQAVSRRDAFEREQAVREAEAARSMHGNEELEKMDEASPNALRKPTINVNTMKRADGTYPPWISGNLKNKLSKMNKAAKKKKKLNMAKSSR